MTSRLPVLRVSLAVTALAAVTASPAFAQWRTQPSGTDAEFRGLSPVSASVVWASGTHGRVIRTTDGGTTWRLDSIPGAGAYDLRDIAALDARTAVAITSGDAAEGQAHIYRTTDGGATWTEVWSSAQKGVFLDALAFWDATHGLALSDPIDGHPYLLQTDDGGATWNRIPPDRLPEMLAGEAFFAASGTCLTTAGGSSAYIATGGARTARVFRTTDRGRTWSVAELPLHAGSAASGAFSVAFRDARHGVAVGGDYTQVRGDVANFAITTDGGATWHAPDERPAGYFSAVAPVPGRPATWVAVGLGGTAVSTDDGAHWALVDSLGYNAVSFVAPNAGWAAGPRGRVAAWAGSFAVPMPVRKSGN